MHQFLVYFGVYTKPVSSACVKKSDIVATLNLPNSDVSMRSITGAVSRYAKSQIRDVNGACTYEYISESYTIKWPCLWDY